MNNIEFVYIVVLDIAYEGVITGTVFLDKNQAEDYAVKMNAAISRDLADPYCFSVHEMPIGQEVRF